MFIDARSLPNKEIIETDVCIVGAGAADITLARELIGTAWGVFIRFCREKSQKPDGVKSTSLLTKIEKEDL